MKTEGYRWIDHKQLPNNLWFEWMLGVKMLHTMAEEMDCSPFGWFKRTTQKEKTGDHSLFWISITKILFAAIYSYFEDC